MKTIHLQIFLSVLIVGVLLYSMLSTHPDFVTAHIALRTPPLKIEVTKSLLDNLIKEQGYGLNPKRFSRSCVTIMKKYAHTLCFRGDEVTLETEFPHNSVVFNGTGYNPQTTKAKKISLVVNELANIIEQQLNILGIPTSGIHYN